MNKSIVNRVLFLGNRVNLSDFRVFSDNTADFILSFFYLIEERARGHTQRSVTENDQLLHSVGSDDTNAVLFGKLMRYLLNIHIGGFRFLGVDDADTVDALDFSLAALYLVGVKN